MKKLNKIIENNILGMAIGILIAVPVTYATTKVLESNFVSYDNTLSGLTSDTVQGAIDELYALTGQCPKGYICRKKATTASEISYLDSGKTVQEALKEIYKELGY